MTANGRLTRVQERALAALLATRTLVEAAEVSGVSERTLRRWMASEPFAATYRTEARASAREAVSAVLAAQREAVEVLRTQMHTGAPATRVRAAVALLGLGVKVREDDVEERLAELEQEVTSWRLGETSGLGSTW